MSGAPFVQKPVSPDTQTSEAKAAHEQLKAVLDKLKPADGETKTRKKADGGKKQKKERKQAKKGRTQNP